MGVDTMEMLVVVVEKWEMYRGDEKGEEMGKNVVFVKGVGVMGENKRKK